jgi:L-alanine-DL-glutamate epimerase-like enolase superfamily enzyme
MQITFRTIRLTKLYPLQISRGTSTGSSNLFVYVEDEGHVGVGECAPGTGDDDALAARAQKQLEALIKTGLDGLGPHLIWQRAHHMGIEEPALAGLDIALWDLLAKKANLPLYKMLGLEKPSVITSVTIGISPIEVIKERVPEMLHLWKGKALKIKLGSPDGFEADKASYEAAREAAKPFNVRLRIDANGGWSLRDAKKMMKWLAERDCEYIEQPLAKGNEGELPSLFKNRLLPIYLDESIRLSSDVPKFAHCCDGVNLKLMKTGGITEAVRVVATARAHGLKTMIGCMGESSVSIAAGAAIGCLFDHIDLDSHFNLNPDPAEGLKMVAGVVIPTDKPGHGAAVVE